MKTGQQQLSFINGVLAAFCLGIYIADEVTIGWPMLAASAAVLLLFSLWAIRREKQMAVIGILVLFGVLGFARCSQSDIISSADLSHLIGQTIRLQGTVQEAPRITHQADGAVSVRYVVAVERAAGEKQEQAAGALVYLYVQQKEAAAVARIGDGIKASGAVKPLHGYQNPGRIDTVAAAKRAGITARLHAGKGGALIEPREEKLFWRWVDRTRQGLLLSMQHVMPAQDAAAIFAMLFGGYEGIKPELLEAFTTTGIVHILSVSGSHISLLAGTLAWIGRCLRLRRMVTAGLVIAAIAVYAVFAGCTPPVLRSAAMGSLAFTALVLGRTQDARRLLAMIALLLLALTPRLLYDISFQLSFAATAGLLYMAPYVQEKLKMLPQFLAANFAITISAQLSVLPFLAWYFNTVSLSALVANIVAVPIVEYIIVAGLAAVLIGLLAPLLQAVLLLACSLALGFVYEITRLIAAIPGGNIYLPTVGPASAVLYYALLLLWLDRQKEKILYKHLVPYKKQLLLGSLAFGLTIGWMQLRPQPLQVHFIDVGQGDAALLITPHGKAVMVDAGGSRSSDFDIGARVDLPYLYHYGVRRLDWLVLTHAHEDHAGGAGAIVRKLPVDHVLIGREDRRQYAATMKMNLAAEPAASFAAASPGQFFVVDGVRFEILHTMDPALGGSGNEGSTVIKAIYGRHSWLFTGDLTAAEEQKLVAEQADLASSILKVGHHGSKSSSSEAFLSAVRPQWAVISVGADNGFGHPHAEVLQRLAAHDAKVLRTDQDGAVVFQSDGERLTVRTFAAAK